MSGKRGTPGVSEYLGTMIGLGCKMCGGYIGAQAVKAEDGTVQGMQAQCSNCGRMVWLKFSNEALEQAAPDLLAACMRLVGVVMRSPDIAPAPGAREYDYCRQAMIAIAKATGYPPDFWEELLAEAMEK